MALPIVHFNHPILRKKGAKITAFDATLRELADAMVQTMHAAEGIGLAAQQVGQAVQVCVIDLRPSESRFDWIYDGTHPPLELFMPLVLVNPEVTAVPRPETLLEEGCLSFPLIRGDVTRPDLITVKFKDVTGHAHTLECNGLLARCVQHEVDHLNGVLFIDRMDAAVRAELEPALKELQKRSRIFAKRS